MTTTEERIVSELQTISRLRATGLLEGGQRNKIETLSNAGFSTGDISRLIGTPSKTVSAELSNLKKRKRPPKK